MNDKLLISSMLALLTDFYGTSFQAHLPSRRSCCWKHPHQGLYSINVDGATSTKNGCSVWAQWLDIRLAIYT